MYDIRDDRFYNNIDVECKNIDISTSILGTPNYRYIDDVKKNIFFTKIN